jgi:hypothetical protein
MRIDPNTGNEIADESEPFEIGAYFKKSELVSDEGRGVPVGSYLVRGYCDSILPEWCNTPTNSQVPCTIDHLGSGYFCHQGKIAVVRARVEAIGKGTPIQGYFVRQGA